MANGDRGAGASSAPWKDFAGRVAWPTIALCLTVVGGHASLWWAVDSGRVGLGLGFAIACVLAYVAFTGLHEAAHGNIQGRHASLRWFGEALGWACGALLFAPYSAFKVLHLRHHSRTNARGEDPDLWVAGRSWWSIALRCWTILPHYYLDFLVGSTSQTTAARRSRRSTILGMVVMTALALAGVVSGHADLVFGLWLGPAWFASGFLALAFDWLPHQPHDVRQRMKDTRIIAMPSLNVPLLFQNSSRRPLLGSQRTSKPGLWNPGDDRESGRGPHRLRTKVPWSAQGDDGRDFSAQRWSGGTPRLASYRPGRRHRLHPHPGRSW